MVDFLIISSFHLLPLLTNFFFTSPAQGLSRRENKEKGYTVWGCSYLCNLAMANVKNWPHPFLGYYSRLLGNHPSWEPHCNILPKASYLEQSPSGLGLQEIHLLCKVPSPLSSSHLISREPICSDIDGSKVYFFFF